MAGLDCFPAIGGNQYNPVFISGICKRGPRFYCLYNGESCYQTNALWGFSLGDNTLLVNVSVHWVEQALLAQPRLQTLTRIPVTPIVFVEHFLDHVGNVLHQALQGVAVGGRGIRSQGWG
jgi:hypothetical protein